MLLLQVQEVATSRFLNTLNVGATSKSHDMGLHSKLDIAQLPAD